VVITQIDAGTHSVTIAATSNSGTAYSDSLSVNIADQFNTQLTPNLTAGGTGGGSGGGTAGGSGGGTAGGSGGGTGGGSGGGTTGNTATAELSWSFAGMSCADAQVDTVTVYVDGASAGTVPCGSSGTDGGTITGIAPGSHAITFSAIRGTGSAAELVYKTTGSGTTGDFEAGLTTHLIISGAATTPGTGGVTLTLSFPSGGPDCTSTTGAGTAVTYTLTNPAGTAQAPATFTCGGASGQSAITVCDPGTAGCGAGNGGLTAGVWTVSATASGYTASTAPFSVPNDAVGTGTVTFTANTP